MTAEDRDYIRGWQAAAQGDPFDPHEAPKWREAYLRLLAYRSRK